jgi:hypothetical protein
MKVLKYILGQGVGRRVAVSGCSAAPKMDMGRAAG